MELKINVTGADFSDDLKTILATLSEEDKKDLAKQVMLEWLKSPIEYERHVKEADVLERIREYEKKPSMNLEEAKKSWRWNDFMGQWKSTKEQMIAMIIAQSLTHYKELVKNLVENDEQLKKIWTEVQEVIRQNYPNYVHDATVYHFANQMDSLKNQVQHNLMATLNGEAQLKQIKSQIGLPS